MRSRGLFRKTSFGQGGSWTVVFFYSLFPFPCSLAHPAKEFSHP
jgi:hypothetical protein